MMLGYYSCETLAKLLASPARLRDTVDEAVLLLARASEKSSPHIQVRCSGRGGVMPAQAGFECGRFRKSQVETSTTTASSHGGELLARPQTLPTKHQYTLSFLRQACTEHAQAPRLPAAEHEPLEYRTGPIYTSRALDPSSSRAAAAADARQAWPTGSHVGATSTIEPAENRLPAGMEAAQEAVQSTGAQERQAEEAGAVACTVTTVSGESVERLLRHRLFEGMHSSSTDDAAGGQGCTLASHCLPPCGLCVWLSLALAGLLRLVFR
jgi:hypothetical protein